MTQTDSVVHADAAPGIGLLDRVQPIALIVSIAVGLAVAEFAPQAASSSGALVSIGVFVLITLVMAGVDLSGVARLASRPRFLTAAVVINFVVNPALAWFLATTMLRGYPELQVGLILFLVTPCIGWYLVFTDLAGGDAELGVGLLAINIVLQVLLLPMYVSVLAGEQVADGTSTLVRSVGVFLVLPALVAAIVRRTRIGERAMRGEHVPVTKTVVLMVVVASMFASQGEVLGREFASVARLAIPITVFFVVSFGLAVAAATVLTLPYREMALLVFTTASRNSEASLAIAVAAFASPLVAVAVVAGPVVELPLLMVMVRVLRFRQARAAFQSS